MENYEIVVDPTTERNALAKKSLIFGILADVLCWLVIPGLIFGIMASKKGKEALKVSAEAGIAKNPMAIIGRILGIVAIPCSILLAIYWVVLLIVGIAAAAM